MNLHEMPAAGVVESLPPASKRAQDERIAEEIRGGLFGQPGLPRHLDGDRAHELPAKILLGPEDGAERTAGLHVEQLVLAGERLTQQPMFESKSVPRFSRT